jgi:ribosomal protein L25 (general stress protein Ctc)
MEQSKRDAKDGEIPVVIFKKNNHEVLVQMRFEDFMRLYKEGGTFGNH